MPPATAVIKPSTSDDAVKARTGKVWSEWFDVLDKAGAADMTHKEIVALIAKRYKKIDPWYQQEITVTYEKARGLRQDHQKPNGYEISVSRTINVSASVLFEMFENRSSRRKWLPEAKLAIRRARPNKSMRVTWVKDNTSLDVNFYDRGDHKAQVTVQHGKLPNKTSADRMKVYWGKALDRLKDVLSE